jgi:hypothetical protein
MGKQACKCRQNVPVKLALTDLTHGLLSSFLARDFRIKTTPKSPADITGAYSRRILTGLPIAFFSSVSPQRKERAKRNGSDDENKPVGPSF